MEKKTQNDAPFVAFYYMRAVTFVLPYSNLKKTVESSPNGLEPLWENEKLLIKSNFSCFHSVFKRLVQKTRKNHGLFGEGLKCDWYVICP